MMCPVLGMGAANLLVPDLEWRAEICRGLEGSMEHTAEGMGGPHPISVTKRLGDLGFSKLHFLW